MLAKNQTAPNFKLPFFDTRDSEFYSDNRTAFITFYKFSCPVCQLALPFIEKIYRTYGDAFYFVAIAQDPAEKVIPFRQTFQITIPTLMDLPPYPVSNQYGIHTVPSIFVVNPDRKIEICFHGFDKKDLQSCADFLAANSGRQKIDLFEGTSVPDFRPG